MNVFQKLNDARERFHKSKLNKSGHNKFAGYKYFELSDFVVPALQIFKEVGLTSVIRFGKDMAEMCIVNTEKPDEVIVITSPMSSAALKGCHEVQNLGAVQTYIRRYLWVAALEIVEHDALDSTTGRKGDGPVVRPTEGTQVNPDRESLLQDVAIAIQDRMEADDIIGAWEEFSGVTDADEKTFIWSQLSSSVRSALKKHSQSLKSE
jgi:hypothetical protein